MHPNIVAPPAFPWCITVLGSCAGVVQVFRQWESGSCRVHAGALQPSAVWSKTVVRRVLSFNQHHVDGWPFFDKQDGNSPNDCILGPGQTGDGFVVFWLANDRNAQTDLLLSICPTWKPGCSGSGHAVHLNATHKNRNSLKAFFCTLILCRFPLWQLINKKPCVPFWFWRLWTTYLLQHFFSFICQWLHSSSLGECEMISNGVNLFPKMFFFSKLLCLGSSGVNNHSDLLYVSTV